MSSFIFLILLLKNTLSRDYKSSSSQSEFINNSTKCVTYENLRFYNYTDTLKYYDSSFIFPENYCYGVLTYNITVRDFYNITLLNLEAYKKYQSLLLVYYFYIDNPNISFSSNCLGYFRHIACYSVFPACVDYNNGTLAENGICESACRLYDIVCDEYTFKAICEKNSTEDYCAGVNKAEYLNVNMRLALKACVILFFVLFF